MQESKQPEVEHEVFHDPNLREGGEYYDFDTEFEDFDEPRPMAGDNPLEDAS